MNQSSVLLKVSRLNKSYEKRKILENISLEVMSGESVVLMGPSGSGKTTLFRLITGLELPDSGEIYLENRLVSSPKISIPPFQRNLGVVFQSPALWPHMDVLSNILFATQKKDTPAGIHEFVDLVIDEMEIRPLLKAYPSRLSGGEARRVSIARALASRPRLMLMDEPLTNLDSTLKDKMLEMIKRVTQEFETTLIYITHDDTEARYVSDKCYRLNNGVLTLESTGF
ncbi:MAG: ABC transporter, ATP-binding protein [Clostridiales bacterium 38_11]|nr:MAG: ABC transporter, ATP-binding protein [Clostridiales bacterium 38_11]HBH12471.1 ABC transporter [Clostridiales bacterium]